MSGFSFGPASPGVAGYVPATGITDAMIATNAAIATTKLSAPVDSPGDADPGDGVTTLVPTTIRERTVYGSFSCLAGTGTARVDLMVETGVGTGVYTIVQMLGELLATGSNRVTFNFNVLPGRRWKYVKTLTGTGIATLNALNHTEE